MVIDSIQVSPLQLPFQAWPMMMAPVYGGGGPVASPGYTSSLMSGLTGPAGPTITGFFGQPQPGGQSGQTVSGLGGFVPFQAVPMMTPWGGQPVYMGGQFAPQAAMVPFQTTPASEQQALDSLMQEVTAGPIRKLHDYLEAHSQKHGQLAHCIPVVQEAAKAFGTRDYTQALAQIYQVYRYLAALRASIPDLPGL
jgi:hypothetical protein